MITLGIVLLGLALWLGVHAYHWEEYRRVAYGLVTILTTAGAAMFIFSASTTRMAERGIFYGAAIATMGRRRPKENEFRDVGLPCEYVEKSKEMRIAFLDTLAQNRLFNIVLGMFLVVISIIQSRSIG